MDTTDCGSVCCPPKDMDTSELRKKSTESMLDESTKELCHVLLKIIYIMF